MSKDTFYFSHDYNARSDDKIRALIRKHGMLGYGLFWAIIEDLYNNTNVLRLDYEGIAYELRTNYEIIFSVINDFDLFVFEGETFGSLSVQNRLEQRKNKSEKARESVLKRWKNKESYTNVLRNKYERNTIKERKGKENKGNKSKVKDIEIFVDDKFSEPYFKFIEYRKEIKKALKTTSMHACYDKLVKLSENNPIIAEKIVMQSIENGWVGLFELKESKEKNLAQKKESVNGYEYKPKQEGNLF